MNGVHDLGGLQGFGPLPLEENEPLFHAQWERRAFALTLAMAPAGGWNLDMSRHARESLPPHDYLGSSYYEIWLRALQELIVARGLATREEIESGTQHLAPAEVPRVLKAEDVAPTLARGGPVERPAQGDPSFSPGDRVRARNMHPRGHTRLPRYVRGHAGEIAAVRGFHVFPDANAHGLGEQPHWLYGVRFSARTLWGDAAAAGDEVMVDLWEPYLEAL